MISRMVMGSAAETEEESTTDPHKPEDGEETEQRVVRAMHCPVPRFYFTEGRGRSPFRLFDELVIIRQTFQQAEKNSGNANNMAGTFRTVLTPE